MTPQYRGICDEVGNAMGIGKAGRIVTYLGSGFLGAAVAAGVGYATDRPDLLEYSTNGLLLGVWGMVAGAVIHIPVDLAMIKSRVPPRKGSRIAQGFQAAAYATTVGLGLLFTSATDDTDLEKATPTVSSVVRGPSHSGQPVPVQLPSPALPS